MTRYVLETRGLIRSFPDQGITVLLSSHILGEVQYTADTVGIIVGGRLVYENALHADGDLEALFMDVCRKEGGR